MPTPPALVARRRASRLGALTQKQILARQGTLKAPPSNWRDRLTTGAQRLGAKVGLDERRTGRLAQKALGIADYIPFVGDAATGADAIAAGRKGNYGQAGALSLAAMVGVIPGAGDAAAAGIKSAVKAATKPARAAARRRPATRDDFLPENIGSIRKRDDWAILTAQNPKGVQASPEANAQRMAALKADLDADGIEYIDGGVGKYGNDEDVLTLLNVSEARARQIGKKYDQDSVLTHKGLIFHDGRVAPAKGVNTFDADPEDYFTKLPNGSRFAVDIDFDNIRAAPRASVLRDYTDGGAVNPDTLHSPYSPVKMRKTHAEQASEIDQTHQFSQAPVMRPEDFKVGSSIVPLVGDRTATGRALVGVDGRKLSAPLPLEGGARYPHFQADMGHDGAWASHNSVTKAISNNVQRVANGGDVHGVYSAMGPRSGDFSTMMSDALLRQLPEAPISKGALSQFDAQLRRDHPRFAGISDPSRADELRAQLLKKGSLRLDFVKAMDDAKRQAAGFPDVASTRYAITDPALRHAPEGTTGLTIAKMDTSAAPTNDAAIPHTSYPSQIKGAFSGGFEVPLAREDVFPDFFKGRRAAGVGALGDRRSFEISSVNQPVDQQWIDNLSAIIEQRKAAGQGW